MSASPPPTSPVPVPDIVSNHLPAVLEGNEYFQAGFGLAVVGFGMSLLRRGGVLMQLVARRQFLTSMEITNRDPSYVWLSEWIEATIKDQNVRRVCVQTKRRQTLSGKSISSYSMSLAEGRHFLRLAISENSTGHSASVNHSNEQRKNKNSIQT